MLYQPIPQHRTELWSQNCYPSLWHKIYILILLIINSPIGIEPKRSVLSSRVLAKGQFGWFCFTFSICAQFHLDIIRVPWKSSEVVIQYIVCISWRNRLSYCSDHLQTYYRNSKVTKGSMESFNLILLSRYFS